MAAELPTASGDPGEDRMLPRMRELAMSAAWHGGLARNLRTSGGQPVSVIFRGHWSHGFGPDFVDAMIQVGGGPVETGSVEIHRAASDWQRHGHHLDPRYNDVILHVVAKADVVETRREDGAIVPVVELDVPDADLFAIDQELPEIWATLGQSVCAEDLARREPTRLKAALLRLGDRRLSERASRHEGELTVAPLPEVLARGLFDAFGYSQNREPMNRLAAMLIDGGTFATIASTALDARSGHARALLFGAGGFLPMSPADAHMARLDVATVDRIEARWREIQRAYPVVPLPATAWTRARTRPANHPAARLSSLGALLAATAGDPATPLLECLRSGADPVAMLARLASDGSIALGTARAIAITASVVLPVAMAWAHHAGDTELEDAVAKAWAGLPRSEWSRPARRALAQAAGEAPLGRLGERAIQGLLHLDRALCTPRRCFECPVAAEVIRDRQRQRSSIP